MPVPIVNVMVVVLRNSLAPINRIITNVCMKGPKYEENLGFMFFRGFGNGCHQSNLAMNRVLSQGQPGAKSEQTSAQENSLNNRELFKLGVEWWSEIFIFYGILTTIAYWEISKFAKKARI